MNPIRLEQIATFYRKAHGEGMGYELWDDATQTIGQLLAEVGRLRASYPALPTAEERIGEIQQRLALISPYPWKWDGTQGGERAYFVDSAEGEPVCQVFGNGYNEARQEEYGEHDHAFLLNAPDDIAYLLARLQDARAVAEDAFQEAPRLQAQLQQAQVEGAGLREEVKRLKQEHTTQVLDILRDMRLPLIREHRPGARITHRDEGRNLERAEINEYCRTKAYEFSPEGIGPDPAKAGEWDTQPTAPTAEEGEKP